MSDLLGIGKSGLYASKKSLEVTGHNLANVNTEGYSRQRVMQSTAIPTSSGGFVQGSGVKVDGVRRFDDEFLDQRLNNAVATNQYYKSRSEELDQVQQIFNEVDTDGLNQTLNKFFNSFRDLANQPENETIRSVVRDTAQLVVKDFHRIRDTLDRKSENIDLKIATSVTEINQVLHHLADLNGKIATLEIQNGEVGDLRDQRDLALKQLSSHFNIHTYTDDKKRFVVSVDGVGTLVAGLKTQDLAMVTKNKTQSSNNMDNSAEIVLRDRPSQSISSLFQNGSLSSLVKLKNQDIQKLQNDIDQIAFQFHKSVNDVHRQGFVNRKIELDEEGKPLVEDRLGPTTGLSFFEDLDSADEAAKKLDLALEVKDDLSNIAAAKSPNSPGNNEIAIAISKLQHERILNDGTITLEEKFLKLVGNIGLEAGKAKLDAEQSSGLLAQAVSMRERLSGVSIDEETANMVRFQQAYAASAQMMKAAEEMFKTVLEIKR